MTERVHLYAPEAVADIPWPATDDGEYARRYLIPLLTHGVHHYVKNAHADFYVVLIDNVVLPISLPRIYPDNSYVCSPFTHYWVYPQEELHKLENPLLRSVMWVLLRGMRTLYSRRFDNIVLVNNWLLSTNLYPALSEEQIRVLVAFLIERFPRHPIVFRSLDTYGNPLIVDALKTLGCRMVFSRQVFYQPPREALKKRQVKIDRKQYQRSVYELVRGDQFSEDDVPRIAALYRMLYLEKYSPLNPQFTEAFFRKALQEGLLTLRGFRKEGRLDAVMGYFSRNGIMTQPLFGYDTGLAQEHALYRLLSMQVVFEGLGNEMLVHASAGVGAFKRMRGGVPVNEYNAVYDAHLPGHRRWRWALLQRLLDSVAVPMLQKYDL